MAGHGAVVDTMTVACTAQANCGPDSGGGNNRLVILWIDSADDPERDGMPSRRRL